MLDFGEELTIETFKIPWLIWIQIIILLLLIILLYGFSIFPLDLSAENNNNNRNNSSAFPSSSKIPDESQMNKSFFKQKTTVKNRLQPFQMQRRGEAQCIKGEIVTSTSRRIEEINTTATAERGSTSAKELGSINYHPCYYFKIARIAFLKCLGLHSENSSSSSELKKDR